ncbi:RNA pol II accessory factor, Cdc73 family-domain-containing protein [Xylariales sp. PMI_506]|nr:RNA pol II accessory factor, Cdc73 family-domain-containing protein [Xylariales sp. PMI_506]
MATADLDPLLLLRQSIASGSPVIPTASDDASAQEVGLAKATHLTFTTPSRISLPITAPTRFVTNDTPVDLRSIYFLWLKREVSIPEYNASASQLDDELAGGKVHKLAYLERLDLVAWLEGASEESEYIKPLTSDKDASASSTAAALASKDAAAPAPGATTGRSGKGTLDPRLAVIYNSERKMGDRNTALRGIKPTDFSHVRKIAAPFMSKKTAQPTPNIASNPSLALNPKQRRPDPIILLSPSASSLLRMNNAKSFLEGGKFVPADSPAAGSSDVTMLHINRLLKDIEPNRPMRFVLVESTERFKPEYWSRVVAVFTTGQSWQFKSYKWANPHELFRHVPGVYVGWRQDPPPETVQSWGHRVTTVGVERWKDVGPNGVDSSRWRDREVVDQIWRLIENNMRQKGWTKDRAPSSI